MSRFPLHCMCVAYILMAAIWYTALLATILHSTCHYTLLDHEDLWKQKEKSVSVPCRICRRAVMHYIPRIKRVTDKRRTRKNVKHANSCNIFERVEIAEFVPMAKRMGMLRWRRKLKDNLKGGNAV